MIASANPIHITLQGKGGVGKTFATILLAQYLIQTGTPIRCYDTAPVNDTFRKYTALDVTGVDILSPNNGIDSRAFDALVKSILDNDSVSVIDNGAATFVPLMAYLVENRVLDLLHAAGRPVIVHSVLTGGQAFNDTCHGLRTILEALDAPIVVWINEYFGPVEHGGKTFEQSLLYTGNASRFLGTVRLGRSNPNTFGKDIEQMLSSKMTFVEALESERFTIMPRQRLKMTRDAIFEQLASISL